MRIVRLILASSRYFIVIAVLSLFVASAAVMVDGGLTTAQVVVSVFRNGNYSVTGAKLLSIELVSTIDLFLLGTVLYIVAIGLYELFIDADVPMPAWLRINTLDNLKELLLGLVVVLLAVTFLGTAVTWDGTSDILSFGVAVGVVIGVVSAAITVLARARAH